MFMQIAKTFKVYSTLKNFKIYKNLQPYKTFIWIIFWQLFGKISEKWFIKLIKYLENYMNIKEFLKFVGI